MTIPLFSNLIDLLSVYIRKERREGGREGERKEGRKKEKGRDKKSRKLSLQSPKRDHRVKIGCHHKHIISAQEESNKRGQGSEWPPAGADQSSSMGNRKPLYSLHWRATWARSGFLATWTNEGSVPEQ